MCCVSVVCLQGLVSLDLSANLLKSLDGSIGKLKDLKILRLQDNLLPKIPVHMHNRVLAQIALCMTRPSSPPWP